MKGAGAGEAHRRAGVREGGELWQWRTVGAA